DAREELLFEAESASRTGNGALNDDAAERIETDLFGRWQHADLRKGLRWPDCGRGSGDGGRTLASSRAPVVRRDHIASLVVPAPMSGKDTGGRRVAIAQHREQQVLRTIVFDPEIVGLPS